MSPAPRSFDDKCARIAALATVPAATREAELSRFLGDKNAYLCGDAARMVGERGKLREAKALAADRPVLLGSGATEEVVAAFLGEADGIIVGSSLKVDGVCENPVDVARVRRFVAAAHSART